MNQKPKRLPKRRLNVVQLVLIVCVLAFAAWYVYITVRPSQGAYGTVSAGMLGAHYTGDALIVRNETPYEAEGVTRVEYSAEEGKVRTRGLEICNVYSSGYSSKDMTTLQDYRDQIRDYQRKLLQNESTYDAKMERVESDVLARAREVRDIISGSRGNLTTQESLLNTAIDVRQEYIRTKYATDQRLSRLYEDEINQTKTINAQKRQHAAVTDTLVSFYSDGYEYGLTLENYDSFTPAQVRAMIRGEKPQKTNAQKNKTTIYRTIADGEWAVLFLVNDTSWNPVVGQTYELQLERFENTLVSATVERCTRSGGELLVCLKVHSSVEPVLYMRTCSATLGDYMATLRVPSRAIYQQDGMMGVVVTDGVNEMFIPVQVIYDAGEDVYVTAVTPGLLVEGQTVLLF